MRALPAEGGCWPTADQVLLLRAGLLELDEAQTAWTRWRARHAPETADHVALRLFPLIYRNLLSAGLPDSDLHTLKGAYQAVWLRNQLLFKQAAAALQALESAGIRTMVLKGVALAAVHYRDAGARPMNDIDVLVPWRDVDRALATLAGAGWSASDGLLRSAHAVHLHDGAGRALDLHWFSLSQAASDDGFWSGSIEIDVLGVPTRTLSPADQLLHVAAHGGQWNAVPPVRWMADAAMIERSAGSAIDWQRLVLEAKRRRMTMTVSASLEHLVEAVRFPAPPWVLDQLRRAPKTRVERWLHASATRPNGTGNWLLVELERFRRRARLDPSLHLSDFLQDHFGVDSRRQLLKPVARKASQMVLVQAARRLAPRLVRTCSSCGRQFVRLRPATADLCTRCRSNLER